MARIYISPHHVLRCRPIARIVSSNTFPRMENAITDPLTKKKKEKKTFSNGCRSRQTACFRRKTTVCGSSNDATTKTGVLNGGQMLRATPTSFALAVLSRTSARRTTTVSIPKRQSATLCRCASRKPKPEQRRLSILDAESRHLRADAQFETAVSTMPSTLSALCRSPSTAALLAGLPNWVLQQQQQPQQQQQQQQQARTQKPAKGPKFCHYCGKAKHDEARCFRKKHDQASWPRSASVRRQQTQSCVLLVINAKQKSRRTSPDVSASGKRVSPPCPYKQCLVSEKMTNTPFSIYSLALHVFMASK